MEEQELEDSKLHEAVRYGDTNVVREALLDGLDANAIGLLQWTPVQEAACNGDLEILQILLQHKGDPNAKDKLLGSTALHYAAKEGNIECLQALLDTGGLSDVQDNNGLTPLDVAIGKCYDLLDDKRIKNLSEAKVQAVLSSTTIDPPENNVPDNNEEIINKIPTAWGRHESEENSLVNSSGYLQLSFEYNSKTKMFKIRVWMLQDLLLPPVEASTINRIYVRSQLLPDRKGESKRRSDEHIIGDKIWNQTLLTLRRRGNKESFKAVFLPCTFKFSKPLEYQNITKEFVSNRVVHLDVCAKQKYGRNFVIATIQIPLKEAVKKLVKEKFLLHPCINICMPDNVHAFDPKDILVCPDGMYRNLTTSNPNIRTKSKQSLAVENEPRRATSDNDLKAVRCHSTDSVPSIVVNVPESTDSNEDISEILEEIRIMDTKPKSNFLSKSSPEFTTIEMKELDLPHATGNGLLEVKVHSASHSSPNITVIDMEDVHDENFNAIDLDKRLTSKSNNLKVSKPGYVLDVGDSTKDSLMFKKKNETILTEDMPADKQRVGKAISENQKDSNFVKNERSSNIKNISQNISNDPPEKHIKTKKVGVKQQQQTKTKLKRRKQERLRVSPISNVSTVDETTAIDTKASRVPINQYTFTRPITKDLVQTELGLSEVIELDDFKKQKSHNLNLGKLKSRPQSSPIENFRQNLPVENSLESGSILPPVHSAKNQLTQLHIERENSDLASSEHFRKMLVTPEFRQQRFQRTKDVVHPARTYLGSNSQGVEEHELVFIPGTPTETPISKISSHIIQGRNSPPVIDKNLSSNLKTSERLTINQLQQSWL